MDAKLASYFATLKEGKGRGAARAARDELINFKMRVAGLLEAFCKRVREARAAGLAWRRCAQLRHARMQAAHACADARAACLLSQLPQWADALNSSPRPVLTAPFAALCRCPAARCCPPRWRRCWLAWRAPAAKGVTRPWQSVSPASLPTDCAPARQRRQVCVRCKEEGPTGLTTPLAVPAVAASPSEGWLASQPQPAQPAPANPVWSSDAPAPCWGFSPTGASLAGNVLEAPLRRTLYLASRSTDKRLAGAAGASYVFLQRAAAASPDAACRAKVRVHEGHQLCLRGSGRHPTPSRASRCTDSAQPAAASCARTSRTDCTLLKAVSFEHRALLPALRGHSKSAPTSRQPRAPPA